MTVSLNVVQESINYSAIAVPEQYAIGTGAQIAVFFLRLLGGAMCENNISQLHTFGKWNAVTKQFRRDKPGADAQLRTSQEEDMAAPCSTPARAANDHLILQPQHQQKPVNGRCDDVTSSMRCCRFTSTSGHNCLDLQVWHLCVHLS